MVDAYIIERIRHVTITDAAVRHSRGCLRKSHWLHTEMQILIIFRALFSEPRSIQWIWLGRINEPGDHPTGRDSSQNRERGPLSGKHRGNGRQSPRSALYGLIFSIHYRLTISLCSTSPMSSSRSDTSIVNDFQIDQVCDLMVFDLAADSPND